MNGDCIMGSIPGYYFVGKVGRGGGGGAKERTTTCPGASQILLSFK